MPKVQKTSKSPAAAKAPTHKSIPPATKGKAKKAFAAYATPAPQQPGNWGQLQLQLVMVYLALGLEIRRSSHPSTRMRSV